MENIHSHRYIYRTPSERWSKIIALPLLKCNNFGTSCGIPYIFNTTKVPRNPLKWTFFLGGGGETPHAFVFHSTVHQVLRGRLPATWLAEPQASMPRETAPVLLHRVFLTILRRARSMIWAANNSAHGPKFPWVQQKKSFELHVSRMEQVQGFFFIQSELKCTIFV